MFDPGWYHTGLDGFQWPGPQIEYFASGPGYAERNFDRGPFQTFQEAKNDLLIVLYEYKEAVKQSILKAKEIKKAALLYKDLIR